MNKQMNQQTIEQIIDLADIVDNCENQSSETERRPRKLLNNR